MTGSPSPVYFGPKALSEIFFIDADGYPQTVTAIYHGANQVYSDGLIGEIFTDLGILENWIIDGLGDIAPGLGGADVAAVFNDANQLVTGTGTLIGTLAAFVANPSSFTPGNTLTSSSPLGAIIAQIPSDISGLETGLCSELKSLSADITNVFKGISTAITGILNGNGVVGGNILETDWNLIIDSSNPLAEFESLVGITAVNNDLGALLGIIVDDTTGVLGKSTNFLTDLTGAVVGLVTCGQYQASAPQDIVYPIGVSKYSAKMFIPSGMVSLPTTTSYSRFNGTTAEADGYVETSPTTAGAPGYVTQVFRRWDNSGSAASGVGLDLRSSTISLVGRSASSDTLVAPGVGSYTVGDKIRLTQSGNEHTVTKNGLPLTTWTDSSNAYPSGAGNRSVAMSMQASQELLGPSNYSPSLKYVLAV